MEVTTSVRLQEIEKVEIIPLVDNLVGNGTRLDEHIQPPEEWVDSTRSNVRYLWAGHGFSALVSATLKKETVTVLYDTGPTSSLVSHNFKALGLNTADIDSIVMSHGHWDHFGGLQWILKTVGAGADSHTSVYVHPRMFLPRSVVSEKKGRKVRRELPHILSKREIIQLGGDVVSLKGPVNLHNEMFLISGEVPRETTYETGYLGHEALIDDKWVDDRLIIDDRCLILRVKHHGLVIVSGCSHAGIVNMVRFAIRLTGEERVAAVIGGLHLITADKQTIENTINDLKEVQPMLLALGHCTGWRAQQKFADVFKNAFTPSSVGTKYVIGQ